MPGQLDYLCKGCFAFKPLIFYKNLLHDPLKAGEKEISDLTARRTLERELVLTVDAQLHSGSEWYFISVRWLHQWKCFVLN